GNQAFRVLQLLPSKNYEADLCCELTGAQYDKFPKYEALSYAWDAQVPEYPIYCEDKRLLITKNCDAALRCLRKSYTRRLLWVDSICINQNDIAERNCQVPQMSTIYQCAQEVAVWLGESDECSD
ncbi:uncharacterized protein K452DRAFT_207187, partial [Aplosporella prunicola CBS 121167]